MNTTKKCGMAIAFAAYMMAGFLQAQEVVALFTFRDMSSRNDGTTLPDRHLSVGMQPTLTMVEAGGSLIDPNGAGGLNQTFIDPQGVRYSNNISASWTSGLIGAENVGKNYFEFECSSLGICDLMLRFDIYATTETGPSELTLELAVNNEDFQTLETLAVTRNNAWHAYTNNLAVSGVEHAERVRIRGTWSADTTYGSARIDNLMLTANFTNSFGRVAYYPFTSSSVFDTAGIADLVASSVSAVSTGSISSTFYNTKSNTVSRAPCIGAIPLSDQMKDNYYRFSLMPQNRAAVKPTHLRGYFCTGSGTGNIEAAMVIGKDEISLGTETIIGTERPYTFVIPTNQTHLTTLPMEFKIYFTTEGENSMRMDDLELLGFIDVYPVNTVVADFPFTGSVTTDAANHPRVNVSTITSHGAGALGYYTGSQFGTSESGSPRLSVDGFDGDAQDRYIAFDVTYNSTTSLNPTLLSFYARTGSGNGFVQAEIVAGEQTFPLGAFWLSTATKMFCYSVKEDLIPKDVRSLQIRFCAWGFALPETTLRIDDIKMEAVIGDLPPKGTIIYISMRSDDLPHPIYNPGSRIMLRDS